MENMKELNMKELEHAGGVVVEVNGKFWAASPYTLVIGNSFCQCVRFQSFINLSIIE